MLSRMQIQSCTDQKEFLKLPAIATGSTAGVIPWQLAVWSYPRKDAGADQASFNMVTAMLCRIHQSGDLTHLGGAALNQVKDGIRIYKALCDGWNSNHHLRRGHRLSNMSLRVLGAVNQQAA